MNCFGHRAAARLLPFVLLMVAAGVAAAGCSTRSRANPSALASPSGSCVHAIHAYLDGQRVDFCAPTGGASPTAASAVRAVVDASTRGQERSPALRTQDFTFIDQGNGGGPQTLGGMFGSQFLIWGATLACLGDMGITAGGPNDVAAFRWDGGPNALWQGLWFNFGNAPLTCDQRLAREEVLMCVAQKLADVADAPATTTWQIHSQLVTGGQDTWVIPPQATADRFIVRDLAIATLSALALDDDTWVISHVFGDFLGPCTGLYEEAASFSSTGSLTSDAFAVFQDPTYTTTICGYEGAGSECTGQEPTTAPIYFQPAVDSALSASSMTAAADARLLVEAHEIRAASRLLQHLIMESIEADVGAAAQKRAKATDPRAGNEAAWGVAANEDNSFDTIAHAARILFGRNDYDLGPFFDNWNTAPYGPTSTTLYAPIRGTTMLAGPWPMAPGGRCQAGTASADILATAYGPDLSARTEDVPAATDAQRAAARMIESNGIVIPRASVTGDLGLARQAIIAQLVASTAIASGNATTDATGNTVINPNFNQDPRAVALQRLVNQTSDADLRWAIGRTYDLYRLLANTADGATTITLDTTGNTSAGLRPASYVVPGITSLGGAVVKGGMPRNDLAADFTARAGPMEVASVCSNAQSASGPLNPGALPDSLIYQDVFSLGVFLYREMGVLDTVSKRIGNSDLLAFTDATLAEIRAWTGPGWIQANTFQGGSPIQTSINIFASGIVPVAGSTLSLVLVDGQPWHADCVAGLRGSCPDDLATHVAQPDPGTAATGPDQLGNGLDWAATFSSATWGANFAPAFQGANPATHLVYVVIPAQGTQVGRVLGALPLRSAGDHEVIAVSDLRTKLLNAAMGFGPQGGSEVGANCGSQIVSDSRVGESPGFCIDGVARRTFVPLANELTSDTTDVENSWKHYLTLAQNAAANADALGKQLLDVGLQIDMQRQQAGEQLGQLCGSYSPLGNGSIQVTNGQITAPNDSTLQACLKEPTTPVVGLGPPGSLAASDVKSLLGCVDVNGNPGLGASNPVCSVQDGDITLLNLLRTTPLAPQGTPTSGDRCADAKTAAQFLRASGAGTRNAIQKSLLASYASQDQMGAVAASIRVTVDANLNWSVSAGGVPVMDSRASLPNGVDASGNPLTKPNATLWPGCIANDRTCGGSTLAPVFDAMFRDLDPSGIRGAAMGPVTSDEMGVILWRVEGAFWVMGVVGGGVPAGMFDTWIPAVNFSVSNASAPLSAIYGSGTFCQSSTGLRLCSNALNSSSLRDRVGSAVPNTITLSNAYQEVPSWIRNAYNDHTNYVLVHANNIAFGPTSLQAFFGQIIDNIQSIGSTAVGGRFGWPLLDSQNTTEEYNPLANSVIDPGQAAVWQPLPGLTANGTLLTGYVLADLPTEAQAMMIDFGACPGAIARFGTQQAGMTARKAELRNWKTLSWPGSMVWDQEVTSLDAGVPLPQNVIDITTTDIATPPYATIRFPIGVQTIQGNEIDNLESVQTFFFQGGGVPICSVIPSVCGNQLRTGQTLGYQANWSPSRVIQLWLNSYAAPCAEEPEIIQAVTLSCLLQSSQLAPNLTDPPVVDDLRVLPLYLSWLSHQSDVITKRASTIFLESVPTRVVTDFTTGQQTAATAVGNHGVILQKIESDLSQLARTADGIVGSVQALSLAYNTLGTQVALANIENDIALSNIAVQQIESNVEITNAIAGAVTTTFSALAGATNPVGAIGAVGAGVSSNVGAAIVTLLELEKKAVLSNEEAQQAQLRNTEIGSALNTFNTTTSQLFTAIRQGLDELNSQASDTRALLVQLQNDQEQVAYEAGKASGADFVRDSSGNVIPYAVNTVLRRQYGVTQRRYTTAVENAKYLAYLARLSIEQRFGVRLDEVTSQLGTLDPPAVWADDICNLSGVDYQTFRAFDLPDGGASANSSSGGSNPEQQLIAQFADQFIGDYVTKLANFVEFYNIAHPSHQGTDTTVLSLKQDLLPPKGICRKDARNMLFFSDDLTQSEGILSPSGPTINGWVDPPCRATDAVCTSVEPATAINAGIQGPADGPPGLKASWLLATVTGNGPPAASVAEAGATPQPPPNTVWETLTLSAGTYLLSWWDEGLNADGSPLTSANSASQYGVAVYDSQWLPISTFLAPPSVSWSARHVQQMQVPADGKYAVAFSASIDGAAGSVLIAGVQLEFTANPGAGATPYIGTTASRQYDVPGCKDYTASDLQAMFRHDCDPDGKCFYELVSPVRIDTTNLVGIGSPLRSKFAAGNYNYRDISVAVNLVGTGVRDCTGSPTLDCFGSGYLEYTLVHDAREANVLNATNNAECFNFGDAAINHGKALAAERYITLPIGSADQQLLTQDSIRHQELQGRPIDGSYRLRIWDSPALAWNQLRDVQIVMTYQYWSAVDSMP
jgi:hypothetical protein